MRLKTVMWGFGLLLIYLAVVGSTDLVAQVIVTIFDLFVRVADGLGQVLDSVVTP